MKVLLAILCLIMILFGGGCAVALGGAGTFSLLPIGIVALNGIVLAAIFGWAKPPKPVFYVLAVVDFIIAIGFSIMVLGFGGLDRDLAIWAVLLIGGFAIKGALTWAYMRSATP
jgi:hypothetical protein